MKMGVIGAVALALCAGLFLLEGCTSSKPADYEFDRIELGEYGTMAVSDRYVAQRTEKGVLLSYYQIYMSREGGDQLVYQREEGPEVYEELVKACAAAKMRSWDGYSGVDNNVLDGGGFNLSASFSGGGTVTAHGSNAYPKGFGTFRSAFVGAIRTVDLKSTAFETPSFAVTVPASWVGKVQVDVEDPTFQMKLSEKETVSLVCFYVVPYELSSNSAYVRLGTLVRPSDGEVDQLSVYACIGSSALLPHKEATADQQAILSSLENDYSAVAASVRGVNGYRFIPALVLP